MKALITLVVAGLSVLTASAAEPRTFDVDATRPGEPLPNPQQTLVTWYLSSNNLAGVRRNVEFDVFSFAEYVEVMGATGGEPRRDCLRNPSDPSVLDDYDFTALVANCRRLLDLGLRPYLKLGNVPQKFSSSAMAGTFKMNVRPPDDDLVYERYMKACAEALLAEFGRDELLNWRFAVLTEFENGDWFKDESGDPEKTFQAYCRLYETTARAFASVISPDLTIGVHAMAVTEGLWDERRFLRYAAERKLPLKFLTASFYDWEAGKFTSGLTLPKTLAHLRAAAEAVGFTNLFYAVDEGRLLNGKKGASRFDLGLRIVGDTYQAAYDARVVKQLFDAGGSYFASWGFFSGTNTWCEGLPSVSFFVARETAAFKDMRRVPVVASGCVPDGVEADAVAALSPDGRTLRLMTYAFTNCVSATGSLPVRLRVRLPDAWKGKDVDVLSASVDDSANWYDEWRADRARMGITDDRFEWSPDDPAVLAWWGLRRSEDRQRFVTELMPRYRECARLRPSGRRVTVPADGVLDVSRELAYHAALFVTISLAPDADALAICRKTAGTPVRATTLLVHPEELSEAWIDRAASLGLTTLSIHPWGGLIADRTLDELLARCRTPEFRRLVDLAWSKGLRVEYEAHAGSWLLPRELFREHPDYFREDENGVRTNRNNFCVSNPGAMEIVERRFRQLVGGLYRSAPRYFVWLDDSSKSARCHCPECRVYSSSDQQLLVMNRLLSVLREIDPQAKLAYLAYFNTMRPPEKVRPAEGIFLEYAPFTRNCEQPVSEQTDVASPAEIAALLRLFGRHDACVLEYWYDNSLFSKWTKPERKFVPRSSVIASDVAWYAAQGFGEIASFACFLGPDYERQWGAPDVTAFKTELSVAWTGFYSSTGGRDATSADVRLGCDDRLHFSFKVKDATPTPIAHFSSERDVASVDRVELFLSPTQDLSQRYYCIEITPQGHVLDYAADFFRRFDETWQCRSLKVSGKQTADGYEVTGSLDWRELEALGLTRSNLHLGLYRADFASGGRLVSWHSARPISASPDFHRPGTLFR